MSGKRGVCFGQHGKLISIDNLYRTKVDFYPALGGQEECATLELPLLELSKEKMIYLILDLYFDHLFWLFWFSLNFSY